MKPIAVRAGLAICVGLLIATVATVAWAEPKQGFGLFGGYAGHSLSDSSGATWDTSGVSIGVDFQIPISDYLSFNPFLASSGETVDNCSACTAGHGILGIQLRFWLGDVFLGAHVGSYTEIRTVDTPFGTVSIDGSGSGAGGVIGWEGSDPNVFVALQVDSATIDYEGGGSSDIKGTRLHIGYRWK